MTDPTDRALDLQRAADNLMTAWANAAAQVAAVVNALAAQLRDVLDAPTAPAHGLDPYTLRNAADILRQRAKHELGDLVGNPPAVCPVCQTYRSIADDLEYRAGLAENATGPCRAIMDWGSHVEPCVGPDGHDGWHSSAPYMVDGALRSWSTWR